MADTKLILDRNEASKPGDNASQYVHGVVFDKSAKAEIDGVFSSLSQLDSLAARALRNIADTAALAALPLQTELSLPLVVAPDVPLTPFQLYQQKVLRWRGLTGAATVGIDVAADLKKLTDELIAEFQPGFELAFVGIG